MQVHNVDFSTFDVSFQHREPYKVANVQTVYERYATFLMVLMGKCMSAAGTSTTGVSGKILKPLLQKMLVLVRLFTHHNATSSILWIVVFLIFFSSKSSQPTVASENFVKLYHPVSNHCSVFFPEGFSFLFYWFKRYHAPTKHIARGCITIPSDWAWPQIEYCCFCQELRQKQNFKIETQHVPYFWLFWGDNYNFYIAVV